MLTREETEKVEFKKSTAELDKGICSMSSILNKHGSGELYFGVAKDGTVKGQMVSEKTLRTVSQKISNSLKPAVYPTIEKVFIEDKPCIKVMFNGDDPPYFAFGKAYIRSADEDNVMSPAELEVYILRKDARKNSWDKKPSSISIDDIDEVILRKYVQRSREVGRIAFEYVSKEDTLTRLETLKDGVLTNAAAYYFTRMPLMEVQMAGRV